MFKIITSNFLRDLVKCYSFNLGDKTLRNNLIIVNNAL